MKNFKRLSMTLFDSSNANFKLAVEAQFTRLNPDQTERDLVYITDKGSGVLNPNIYLTVTYKCEQPEPIYMSYPQLFRLREAMDKIKSMVADNSGYTTVDNLLTVSPKCADPIVVSNIGKKNNWLCFKLMVAQEDNNGVAQTMPCVSIEMSTSNGYASVLTAEEFLTVYTIIQDLNLMNLQAMMSIAFLSAGSPVAGGSYYSQPQQYNNYAPQPAQSYYGQNQSGYSRGGYAPRNNGYASRAPRMAPPAPPTSGSNASYRTTAPAPSQVPSHPADADSPFPTSQSQTTLPPRGSQPIMTAKAIEETPVSEIDYNDTAAIDDIFNSFSGN